MGQCGGQQTLPELCSAILPRGCGGAGVLRGGRKADVRQWLPGERDVTESCELPATLDPGKYTLALALIDPLGQRGPFQLAVDAPTQEGRYQVSALSVR